MRTYRIYFHPDKPNPIAVKAGFCWPAFIVGPLWFLANGMWINFLLVTSFVVASHLFFSSHSPASWLTALMSIVWLVAVYLIGLIANPLLAAELVKKGYVFRTTVEAKSISKATEIAMEQSATSGDAAVS